MFNSVGTLIDANVAAVTFMAQQQSGPLGADFGKASPIGLLVIVVLLVVVLALGWDMSRRAKRMNRRRTFAEEHGLDPFDTEGVEKAMAELEARNEQ